MNLRLAAILVAFVAMLTSLCPAEARCFCQCVGGRTIALCDTSSDIRPACVPTLCPPNLAHDKIAPLKCQQRLLCDALGRCRLSRLCQ